jgi:hypothetical protein
MITPQIIRARRGTALRTLLRLAAIPAVAIACEGTTSPNAPQPIVPAPVQPAPVQPAELIKVSGDQQEARPGDQLQPIIVAVRDHSGKRVAGVRVRFSVTAGDGYAALYREWPPGNVWIARYRGPADQVTDEKGEALALWFLGRRGENTLVVTAESEGKPLEVTFRANSRTTGFSGGSFALMSGGTSLKLNDGMAGSHNCIVRSGSLSLSPDGSFEATGDFDCDGFSFNVSETGFYSVSDSAIVLHYLNSNDTAGLFNDRDARGVMSEGTIVFSSLGVAWRYASR